ncbi:MAG: serine hydrolase [Clostridia bacterium]|nr:serine hydrolase [Clostridia bacterium]
MNTEFKSFIKIFVTGCLWGTIGLFVKLMEEQGSSPSYTSFLRLFFGSLFLAVLTLIADGPKAFAIGRKTLISCLLLGVVCQGTFNILYSTSVSVNGVSVASVLLYTAPIFTSIASLLLFREKLNYLKWIALPVNVIGCALTATGGNFSAAAFAPIGVLVGVGAGFTYAMTAVFGRIAMREKSSPFAVATYNLFFGCIFVAIARRPWRTAEAPLDPKLLLFGALFGLIATALAYAFYFSGLSGISETGKVPVVASVEPVIATVIGAVAFGENITAIKIVGICLVLLSILLFSGKNVRKNGRNTVMDKDASMKKLAEAACEADSFNGAWLYAENGAIVSRGACGWRDAENKLPIEEDTVFEMASITKMFTATAVMLLSREGKLNLDDEYADFFPDYPYRGVTIRHLLTHTSGMPDDFRITAWVCPVWENEKRIPPCSEILRFIRESGEEASHAPGETFRYTDVGYCLLAELVESLSGVSFEEYVKKNILEPAGMKDSGIYHTRRDGRPSDRIARNMVLEDGRYVPSDVAKRTASYVIGSDGLNGCDYLYTTASDMFAWDRALREEKVLTREEQTIMYTPVKTNDGEDGEGYGLGWRIESDGALGLTVGHSGNMPGLSTLFERSVDEDRTFVIFCCREYSDARAFGSFRDGMKAVIRGEEPGPVVSVEDIAVRDPDKSRWESFCGKYEQPGKGDLTVKEIYMKDGELCADAIGDGGEDVTFRLYPIGENEFVRKSDMLKLSFGDGCLTIDGLTLKKL